MYYFGGSNAQISNNVKNNSNNNDDYAEPQRATKTGHVAPSAHFQSPTPPSYRPTNFATEHAPAPSQANTGMESSEKKIQSAPVPYTTTSSSTTNSRTSSTAALRQWRRRNNNAGQVKSQQNSPITLTPSSSTATVTSSAHISTTNLVQTTNPTTTIDQTPKISPPQYYNDITSHPAAQNPVDQTRYYPQHRLVEQHPPAVAQPQLIDINCNNNNEKEPPQYQQTQNQYYKPNQPGHAFQNIKPTHKFPPYPQNFHPPVSQQQLQPPSQQQYYPESRQDGNTVYYNRNYECNQNDYRNRFINESKKLHSAPYHPPFVHDPFQRAKNEYFPAMSQNYPKYQPNSMHKKPAYPPYYAGSNEWTSHSAAAPSVAGQYENNYSSSSCFHDSSTPNWMQQCCVDRTVPYHMPSYPIAKYPHEYIKEKQMNQVPSYRHFNPYSDQNKMYFDDYGYGKTNPAHHPVNYNTVHPIKPQPVQPSSMAFASNVWNEQQKSYNYNLIADKYPFHGFNTSSMSINNNNYYSNNYYTNKSQGMSSGYPLSGNTNSNNLNKDYNQYYHQQKRDQYMPNIPEGNIVDFENHIKVNQLAVNRNKYDPKSKLNLKEFLETWGEEDDDGDDEAQAINLPDVVLSNKVAEKKSDTMLYVLESTSIPAETVWSDYKHVQQVDKLPDNIKLVDQISTSNEKSKRLNINVLDVKMFRQNEDVTLRKLDRCDTVIKSPDTTADCSLVDTLNSLDSASDHGGTDIVSSTCSVIKSPIHNKIHEDSKNIHQQMVSTTHQSPTVDDPIPFDFDTKQLNTNCRRKDCKVFDKCDQCKTDEIINDLISPISEICQSLDTGAKCQDNSSDNIILDLRDDSKRNLIGYSFENIIEKMETQKLDQNHYAEKLNLANWEQRNESYFTDDFDDCKEISCSLRRRRSKTASPITFLENNNNSVLDLSSEINKFPHIKRHFSTNECLPAKTDKCSTNFNSNEFTTYNKSSEPSVDYFSNEESNDYFENLKDEYKLISKKNILENLLKKDDVEQSKVGKTSNEAHSKCEKPEDLKEILSDNVNESKICLNTENFQKLFPNTKITKENKLEDIYNKNSQIENIPVSKETSSDGDFPNDSLKEENKTIPVFHSNKQHSMTQKTKQDLDQNVQKCEIINKTDDSSCNEDENIANNLSDDTKNEELGAEKFSWHENSCGTLPDLSDAISDVGACKKDEKIDSNNVKTKTNSLTVNNENIKILDDIKIYERKEHISANEQNVSEMGSNLLNLTDNSVKSTANKCANDDLECNKFFNNVKELEISKVLDDEKLVDNSRDKDNSKLSNENIKTSNTEVNFDLEMSQVSESVHQSEVSDNVEISEVNCDNSGKIENNKSPNCKVMGSFNETEVNKGNFVKNDGDIKESLTHVKIENIDKMLTSQIRCDTKSKIGAENTNFKRSQVSETAEIQNTKTENSDVKNFKNKSKNLNLPNGTKNMDQNVAESVRFKNCEEENKGGEGLNFENCNSKSVKSINNESFESCSDIENKKKCNLIYLETDNNDTPKIGDTNGLNDIDPEDDNNESFSDVPTCKESKTSEDEAIFEYSSPNCEKYLDFENDTKDLNQKSVGDVQASEASKTSENNATIENIKHSTLNCDKYLDFDDNGIKDLSQKSISDNIQASKENKTSENDITFENIERSTPNCEKYSNFDDNGTKDLIPESVSDNIEASKENKTSENDVTLENIDRSTPNCEKYSNFDDNGTKDLTPESVGDNIEASKENKTSENDVTLENIKLSTPNCEKYSDFDENDAEDLTRDNILGENCSNIKNTSINIDIDDNLSSEHSAHLKKSAENITQHLVVNSDSKNVPEAGDKENLELESSSKEANTNCIHEDLDLNVTKPKIDNTKQGTHVSEEDMTTEECVNEISQHCTSLDTKETCEKVTNNHDVKDSNDEEAFAIKDSNGEEGFDATNHITDSKNDQEFKKTLDSENPSPDGELNIENKSEFDCNDNQRKDPLINTNKKSESNQISYLDAILENTTCTDGLDTELCQDEYLGIGCEDFSKSNFERKVEEIFNDVSHEEVIEETNSGGVCEDVIVEDGAESDDIILVLENSSKSDEYAILEMPDCNKEVIVLTEHFQENKSNLETVNSECESTIIIVEETANTSEVESAAPAVIAVEEDESGETFFLNEDVEIGAEIVDESIVIANSPVLIDPGCLTENLDSTITLDSEILQQIGENFAENTQIQITFDALEQLTSDEQFSVSCESLIPESTVVIATEDQILVEKVHTSPEHSNENEYGLDPNDKTGISIEYQVKENDRIVKEHDCTESREDPNENGYRLDSNDKRICIVKEHDDSLESREKSDQIENKDVNILEEGTLTILEEETLIDFPEVSSVQEEIVETELSETVQCLDKDDSNLCLYTEEVITETEVTTDDELSNRTMINDKIEEQIMESTADQVTKLVPNRKRMHCNIDSALSEDATLACNDPKIRCISDENNIQILHDSEIKDSQENIISDQEQSISTNKKELKMNSSKEIIPNERQRKEDDIHKKYSLKNAIVLIDDLAVSNKPLLKDKMNSLTDKKGELSKDKPKDFKNCQKELVPNTNKVENIEKNEYDSVKNKMIKTDDKSCDEKSRKRSESEKTGKCSTVFNLEKDRRVKKTGKIEENICEKVDQYRKIENNLVQLEKKKIENEHCTEFEKNHRVEKKFEDNHRMCYDEKEIIEEKYDLATIKTEKIISPSDKKALSVTKRKHPSFSEILNSIDEQNLKSKSKIPKYSKNDSNTVVLNQSKVREESNLKIKLQISNNEQPNHYKVSKVSHSRDYRIASTHSNDYHVALKQTDYLQRKSLISIGGQTSGKFILKKESSIPKMVITRHDNGEEQDSDHNENMRQTNAILNNALKWQPVVRLVRNARIDRMALKLQRQEKIILKINRVTDNNAALPSFKCRIKLNEHFTLPALKTHFKN